MDATVNASLALLLEQLNGNVTQNDSANVTRIVVGDPVANVTTSRSEAFTWRYILPLYCVILALSVTGNSIVIITLAQNRRIRTVTNVYLLNLAVSDLMLGVFCVPFTLLGQLLRRFVFGAALCKLIPFLQAVSVCVDVWTLVAISLERYFAICRPLASRRWQTQGHAAHIIALVWSLATLACAPILLASQLQRIASRNHSYKCREMWSSVWLERAFNLFLDVVLLPVPFSIMLVAYCLIARKLSTGMKHEIKHCQRQCERGRGRGGEVRAVLLTPASCGTCGCREMSRRLAPTHTMRSTHTIKSIEAKKKVIRMLCVIMIAFFVCWVPIHVINTVYLYNPEGLYNVLGSRGITLLQLLAYMSSCCNPITYCFMNRRFRQACLAIFRCCLPTSGTSTLEAARARRRTQNNSSQDNNARAVRTELEVLESEDCV